MTRFRSTLVALSAALLALAGVRPAVAAAQESTRPVVAVLYFDNNSIGKDRADYDGLGKGIADMLITDLASNPNVRIVERERIQKLLEEQDLATANRVDAATAVRLGKLLQAQYMIVGGFMNDGRGTMVLTARAIEVETSRILNPQQARTRDDDVLGLIAQLSSRVGADMPRLPQRVGDAGTTPQVQPAGSPSTAAADVAVNVQRSEPMQRADADATKPSATPAAIAPVQKRDARRAEKKSAAKQAPARQAPEKQVASRPAKMDTRTALLYAKALDEQDRGNTAGAVELYKAVLTRFPDYAPAQNYLAKLAAR